MALTLVRLPGKAHPFRERGFVPDCPSFALVSRSVHASSHLPAYGGMMIISHLVLSVTAEQVVVHAVQDHSIMRKIT